MPDNNERIPTRLELPKKVAPSGLSDAPVRDTHEAEAKREELRATHISEERSYVDGREMSDEEFLKALSFDGGLNNIMPEPPLVPGYDTMWETTMEAGSGNLRHRLDHLGYTFVKPEECPTYRNHTARTSAIPGVVSYNELVAVKIPKGRKEMIAKRFHHDAPLNAERAIKKKVSELMDYEGKKVGITMNEGTASLGVAPEKKPTFSI